MPRWTSAAILVIVALVACPVAATAQPPWQAADQIRDALFEARSELLLEGDSAAAIAVAERAVAGKLERSFTDRAPAELRGLEAALALARRAVARADLIALAAAQGRAVAALRGGAYALAVAAARDGDSGNARRWLLIRDFRQATRFTRPGVDATAAIDALETGQLTPEDTILAIRKDLLDAYQARLLDALADAETEAERGFDSAAAEATALASGYWLILADEYESQRGFDARTEADEVFAALRRAGSSGKNPNGALAAAHATLDRFTAAPFTDAEQASRANQMVRFLDLVPIEYDDGSEEGRVTIPFEMQEAVAFIAGARSAFNDLAPVLEQRDEAALAELEELFEELAGYAGDANEGATVVPVETVDAAHARATEILATLLPEEWQGSSDEADFDLIEISLDQMEAALSAGQLEQAEQARLTAYAFFEFGPELTLSAFDPALVLDVEGLIWYGARERRGLADIIATEGGAREARETRLVLDEALEDARAKTGEGASDTTVVTNAALIVFREGLEAILILAAITASMIGVNRRLRRPILRGALLALPASVLLFIGAQLILESFAQYGEKLEAVVGLIAIAVLLLVLNWFFHKVYWTGWIAGHRKRSKEILATGSGAAFGTVAGLYILGFTSVFREGFETVLFLQALQLSSGTPIVLAGVSFGFLATALVGALTFKLEQRLPYKRMLIVTGILLALVLMVLVGNTIRTLQGVGWLGISTIDVDFPLWAGTWLGVFPTIEGLGGQALSLAFVIGSYYAAELVSRRRLGKAIAAG